MKIKVFIFFTIFIFGAEPIIGQKLPITYSIVDSIGRRNWNLGAELYAILTYNDAVKSFRYIDTIKIVNSGEQFNYYYRDTLITDMRYNDSNKQRLVMITYSSSPSSLFYLQATVKLSTSKRFELLVIDSQDGPQNLEYILINYLNDVENGKYEKRTKSGRILERGQYCQIDSIYTDTILTYDLESYEDIIKLIPRTKFSIKSGVWYYYSPEGLLVREERYKNCS